MAKKKNKMLGLVQKRLDQEVLDLGVVPFPDRSEMLSKFSFDKNPSLDELEKRADELADLAKAFCDQSGFTRVVVGGANYLTPMLVHSLIERDLEPVFLFLERKFSHITGRGTPKYEFVVTGFVRPYKEMFDE